MPSWAVSAANVGVSKRQLDIVSGVGDFRVKIHPWHVTSVVIFCDRASRSAAGVLGTWKTAGAKGLGPTPVVGVADKTLMGNTKPSGYATVLGDGGRPRAF